MKGYSGICFLLIGAFAALHLIQAQDQTGFISLDCGRVPTDGNYTEKTTNITYTPDANFIDAGKIGKIQKEYRSQFQQQMWSLRSFPNGSRNCYNLNLTRNTNYLIRASFLYGNYDKQNKLPSFDLYIGPNNWTSVQLQGETNASLYEIIHVLTSNHLQVCLVKTGPTIPFISALELRPLKNNTYVPQTGSLMLFTRVYFTRNQGFIRFDEDIHDRTWVPYFETDWSPISTNHTINTSNPYQMPELAMRTAATGNTSGPLNISWSLSNATALSYIYMHFAEIQNLTDNETREFNITYNNGETWYLNFSPAKFSVSTIYNAAAVSSQDGNYNFSFVMTNRSTLPPLINALEIYTVLDLPQLETAGDEVDAMMNIKVIYDLRSKSSWEGDPCSPQKYRWEGIDCSYPDSDPPRITSLNLSASGLRGNITPYISNFMQLQELDLSNNNLTGTIPSFLADMQFLKLINLSGNKNLYGPVPTSLVQKQKSNSLVLNVCETLVSPQNCKKDGGEFPVAPVAASVASLAFVVAVFASIFVFRRKKQRNVEAAPTPSATSTAGARSGDPSIKAKERRVTYSEILRMTNNFEIALGKGGFGTVYHGYLDDTEVAVKMLSPSSAQGYKQFKAEVELLLRVHHKNLVSLVGYCDDGDHLALIYEYMTNGDLKDHLSGKQGANVLTWARRMKIAVEAAQGLEYLHNGCKPPMVHRDVKTTNILLNEHFQAKLADFGLSRSFPVEGESHASTIIAGTPGYLDPEYYKTNWLSEKSDLYSFGVVLLEIITNQPVIDKSREKPHIAEWVWYVLNKGDIKSIIDPRIEGDYDTNAAWKVVELALACVNSSLTRRPTMPHVVMELNECVALEMSRTQGSSDLYPNDSMDLSMSFEPEFTPGPR